MIQAHDDADADTASGIDPTPLAVQRQRTAALMWVHPVARLTRLGLSTPPLVAGRDADCDVVLTSTDVSRRHVQLRNEGGVVLATDLGSRNGTFVNGARVGTAPLGRGQVLRVGEAIAVCLYPLPDPTDEDPDLHEIAPDLLAGPTLRAALRDARRLSASDLSMVIEGETGTGKERVARAVHTWSGRTGSFVAINCAALPEGLAESELFGHRVGAFTGAVRAGTGYLRAAHRGTLFLDEVVDLPAPIQAKLLRALEEREITPLGESAGIPIDVRVVAAARRPLDALVAAGQFRADLYARLAGLSVRLPPLRDRREEIVPLFRELARRRGLPAFDLTGRAAEQLCLHRWPLNVRELDQLGRRLLTSRQEAERITRAALRAELSALTAAAPERLAANQADVQAVQERDEPLPLRLERQLLHFQGNLSRAVAELGISRQRGYRLIQKSGRLRRLWTQLRTEAPRHE